MFSLREFIMKGICASIGKEPEYKVIETAAGWLDKGVLTESDLEEIDGLLTSPKSEEEAETVDDAGNTEADAAAMSDVSETDAREVIENE